MEAGSRREDVGEGEIEEWQQGLYYTGERPYARLAPFR